ncbi:MAG: TrmH family RNA methyltransferase [Bacteroidales bacterium]|nr:TrmH family RNA methyltransferase [Bacteroidales bacterium]
MDNSYVNAVDFFKLKEKNKLASKLMLAAYELRTPENVGALIRLAGNLGIAKVFFIAVENSFKASKIARVAHSSIKHVAFEFCTPEEFLNRIPSDYVLVGVETSQKASNLFTTKLPEKSILLLGNERYGIPQDFLDRCRKTVFIPLLGKTLSMNVSHAAALAAFEWGRQHSGLELM